MSEPESPWNTMSEDACDILRFFLERWGRNCGIEPNGGIVVVVRNVDAGGNMVWDRFSIGNPAQNSQALAEASAAMVSGAGCWHPRVSR